MSFSGELKQELASLANQKECCDISELSALTQTIGILSLKGAGSIQLKFKTDNISLARRTLVLLRHRMHLQVHSQIKKENRFGGRYVSTLKLSEEDSELLLLAMRIIAKGENGEIVFQGVPFRITRRNCCQRAYIRGMFLGAGSINDPKKSYMASFTLDREEKALFLQKVLKLCAIDANILKKGDNHLVYIKQSAQISELCKVMGASRAVLSIEDSIVKGLAKKQAVRALNCDQANIKKQLQSSQRQTEAIKRISKMQGLSSLSPELEELARLRLLNTDAALGQLSQMLGIGKSSVQNRMNKIIKIAEQIEENIPTKLKE